MVDLTRYQPPGVYVEDVTQPIVTPEGLTGSVVTLIGPGAGYQTKTDTLALRDTDGVFLTQKGVFTTAVAGPPAIAAPEVRLLDGTVLAAGTDYTLTVIPSAAPGGDHTVQIKRATPATPANPTPGGALDGDTVQVTYRYALNSYYDPTLFEDYDTVRSTYGEPLGSDPGAAPTDAQVSSPLALAARVAFESGASEVLCVATDPADGDLRAQFAAAYDKVLTDHRAGIVVPLFVDDYTTGASTSNTSDGATLLNFIGDVKAHCEEATVEGAGRIALVGAPGAFDEDTFPFEDVAAGAASKRIVAVYPVRLNMVNHNTSQTIEVSGFYAAAALAARLVFNGVQRGLTREIVRSFAGLPVTVNQAMTKTFKNNLSSKGVCVIEQDRTSRLVVRHGVTTDMTSLTTREISLVRVADSVLRSVQSGLENSGLIGDPIDDEMPARVKGVLAGILEANRLGDVIVEWNNLLVRQQSLPTGDPSVIDCKFNYRPAVPLNYITVAFALDLNSGAVSLTEEAPAA